MDSRKTLAVVFFVAVLVFGIRQLFWGTEPEIPRILEEPTFSVYFAAVSDGGLHREYHSGYGTIEERLHALEAGPYTPGLVNVLPSGTAVLGWHRDGELLIVDFSSELQTQHPGGSYGELLTVFGIVNSLTEFEDVKKVQILVEGEIVDSLAGHFSLREPLARDTSIFNN